VDPFDISADLTELVRTPVLVVCAGAKSILDLPRTLEVLETLGVPVIGYRTDEFPAFYVASVKVRPPHPVPLPHAVGERGRGANAPLDPETSFDSGRSADGPAAPASPPPRGGEADAEQRDAAGEGVSDLSLPVSVRVETPAEAAAVFGAHVRTGGGGAVLGQPCPADVAVPPDEFDSWLAEAEREAAAAGVAGAKVTPFLLARLAELSGGRTLTANRALIVANARLAAEVAAALARPAG
jgi:pseudouridine-5'-phosphate glycosidase